MTGQSMNPDDFAPLEAALSSTTEADAIARLASPDVITQPVADWLGDSNHDLIAGDVLVAVSKSTDDGKPAGLTMDLEPFRAYPRRKTGMTQVERVDSLVALCTRHYVPDVSVVYVRPRSRRVVAVFDDHAADRAGWRSHTAAYGPVLTPEFRAWNEINRESLTQQRLAEHLADWQHTIAEPDAADVYEIAQRFEATTTATFSAGARLATGARQLVYAEEVAANSGSLEIPESLTLSLRVFDDPFAPVQPMRAALRFSIREGALSFRVVLEPLDPVFLTYFESVAQTLTDRGFDVVYGEIT